MKHRTQHRAESEEARRNRLHAETRRENRELRRALARVTKELQKLKESHEVEDGTPSSEVTKPPTWVNECPSCGGQLKGVRLPTGTLLLACRTCGWRKNGRDRTAA